MFTHHQQKRLLAKMWDYMGLIRVYTKRRGAPPMFHEPLVLSSERKGVSVEVHCCLSIHTHHICTQTIDRPCV